MVDVTKVSLLGSDHTVVLPDMATREDLYHAYLDASKKKGITIFRVLAAAIGLCTRIGGDKHANADFSGHRFDVLAYGGEVHSWLREKEVAHDLIVTAAQVIFELIAKSLFPRQSEIESAKNV